MVGFLVQHVVSSYRHLFIYLFIYQKKSGSNRKKQTFILTLVSASYVLFLAADTVILLSYKVYYCNFT